MGVLSEKYIMQRLRKYASTKAGQERISQYRREIFNSGKASSTSLTRERIERILQDVREEFIDTVMDVIITFRGDAVHFTVEEIDDDGRVRASITVDEEALRRESLHYINKDLSIGHGEGVEDILALFAHGYTIDKRPYGFWARDSVMAATGNPLTRIGARMHRDPNPFLSEFVDRMNAQYGGICEITLNDKYEI